MLVLDRNIETVVKRVIGFAGPPEREERSQ